VPSDWRERSKNNAKGWHGTCFNIYRAREAAQKQVKFFRNLNLPVVPNRPDKPTNDKQ